MRIIAGKVRGLRLKTPKGYLTRPTADRIKEALFSAIQGFEVEARVLDLFAGTGALGLEALSRGADTAVFVENNPATQKVLLSNIDKSGMKMQSEIIKMDAKVFLRSFQGEPFDLIFIDPPYGSGLGNEVLLLLLEKDLIRDQGLIVWEMGINDQFNSCVPPLRLVKEKKYGDTLLLFFKHIKEEKGDGRI